MFDYTVHNKLYSRLEMGFITGINTNGMEGGQLAKILKLAESADHLCSKCPSPRP
jgi:hypothetical protein